METTLEVKELADVWGRVREWPEPVRLALASKILQSMEEGRVQPAQPRSLTDLIGLWDSGQSPPTDSELDRILEEERLKKHA
ncbi:MAG: hypothetical protein ABR915_07825 [Thermoguttaceae bacterium]|jgi:hypothetical protein